MARNSTNATSEQSNSISTFDYVIENLASSLNTYYTPLLILVGILGNVASVFIFIMGKIRVQSHSLFLTALAITDTVFLLQLLPPWLNAMGITNLYHRPGFCQVFVYTTYSSCCLSAWLIVAFTIERFVAVLYPLRRNRMCTVARAKTVICLLVVMSLMINLPMIKYAASSQNDCNIDREYEKSAERFNLVDTVVSFSLPLVLIVFLNICIACAMLRRERRQRAAAAAPESPGCTPPSRSRLVPARSQNRVTRMLLFVSWMYVVLNVPAYVVRILAYYYNMGSGEYSGRWAALQTLALMFFNTNFGINFILYCLTGQNFRRELVQAIPFLRRFNRHGLDLQICGRNIGRANSLSIASGVSPTEPPSTHPGVRRVDAMRRRHRPGPYIERWRFDNTRTTRAIEAPPAAAQPMPESIEMSDLGQPEASSPQATLRQDEEHVERPFMFPLFPMGNILDPKARRRSSSPTEG